MDFGSGGEKVKGWVVVEGMLCGCDIKGLETWSTDDSTAKMDV